MIKYFSNKSPENGNHTMPETECGLCPLNCKTNRAEKAGACGEKNVMRIAKFYPHMFEEPPISGKNGSGTIFFTGCSLRCAFCQNYSLSRSERGREITPRELADIFKKLEDAGVHNVNLVTPTHFVPEIAEAFEIYRPKIPVVYNTHSYETPKTLEIIDPYVDIYLPDLKFYSPGISKRYTGKADYFSVAEKAITFMMNSKKTDFFENGMMKSGVVVRHMIMPLCVPDSKKLLGWFAANRKNGAYISLMAQYTPFGNVDGFPELKRPITAKEYERVYEELLRLGITEYFAQELHSSSESFIPDWDF